MDRDNRGARAPQRQGVLEVDEGWAQLRQGARHRPRHPQLLEARWHVHRLDAVRDEVRPARERGEAKAGRGSGQVTQEVEDVRLVAGAPATEDVGVDDDEAHPATSR